MSKPATTISIAFLTVVAAAHVVRFLAAWPVIVDGLSVPLWFSGAAAVVLALLAVTAFIEQRRT
jgi:hypothetical protein